MLMKFALAAALTILTCEAATARVQQQTRRDQQLVACAEDMRRLCPAGLSPSRTLKTCIRKKRDLVGATCRAWLDVPEK